MQYSPLKGHKLLQLLRFFYTPNPNPRKQFSSH